MTRKKPRRAWRRRRCAGSTSIGEDAFANEQAGQHGAGRRGTVSEDFYQDWLCGTAAGVSRGVLSVFESDADHSPPPRADDRSVFGSAGARAAGGAGRGGRAVAFADLPAANAARAGRSVLPICKIT